MRSRVERGSAVRRRPRGPRAERLELEGASIVVFEFDRRERVPVSLTAAEAAIVRLLLAGRSARDIAALRGVSYRTVANQLASIYRKVRVSSVQELLARLLGE